MVEANMRILALDIETAPNKVFTWGLFNQNISINQIEKSGYTLCWAAKWLNDPQMKFASLHKDGKEKMLMEIYRLINEADVVIHFNGVKFDMPILRQEFMLMGWSPPSPVLQIDLYQVVKKQFRFVSNKLEYVAKHLGLGGKVKHRGMELWLECMAGDEKAWKEMEKYNRHDVVLLEKLYDKLLPWIPNHPNHGLFIEDEERVCPNCGGSNLHKHGRYYTATMSYQRYCCNDCGSWSKGRHNDLKKEKRQRIVKGV